jgi:hypothetical protein
MDVLAYQVRAGARKDCLIAPFAAAANKTDLNISQIQIDDGVTAANHVADAVRKKQARSL